MAKKSVIEKENYHLNSWEDVHRYIQNHEDVNENEFRALLDNAVEVEYRSKGNYQECFQSFINADLKYLEIFLEKYPHLIQKMGPYYANKGYEDVALMLVDRGCDLNVVIFGSIVSAEIRQGGLVDKIISQGIANILYDGVDSTKIFDKVVSHLYSVTSKTQDDKYAKNYFVTGKFKKICDTLVLMGYTKNLIINFFYKKLSEDENRHDFSHYISNINDDALYDITSRDNQLEIFKNIIVDNIFKMAEDKVFDPPLTKYNIIRTIPVTYGYNALEEQKKINRIKKNIYDFEEYNIEEGLEALGELEDSNSDNSYSDISSYLTMPIDESNMVNNCGSSCYGSALISEV